MDAKVNQLKPNGHARHCGKLVFGSSAVFLYNGRGRLLVKLKARGYIHPKPALQTKPASIRAHTGEAHPGVAKLYLFYWRTLHPKALTEGCADYFFSNRTRSTIFPISNAVFGHI
jgi:hypothetical protein